MSGSLPRWLLTALLAAITTASPVRAEILVAVTEESRLIAYDSSTAFDLLLNLPITGITSDTIAGIDFRPANSRLYGLGNSGTLYVLNLENLTTASTFVAATPVSGVLPTTFTVQPVRTGIDFDPVTDLLRVITSDGSNRRISPETGQVMAADSDIIPTFEIADIAYDGNAASTPQTTLYGIDCIRDELVTLGGIDGTPSPNFGQVFTVGPLGYDFATTAVMDASKTTLYAIDSRPGMVRTFTINPATGEVTSVSPSIGLPGIIAMAVAPGPQAFPLLLTEPKARVRLNFSKSDTDSIRVAGLVMIPAGFQAEGTTVSIDFGGIIRSFQLDSKGKSRLGDDTFRIRIKTRRGAVPEQVARYQSALRKGNFAADLADEGLVNADVDGEEVSPVLSLRIGELHFERIHDMVYRARKGKSGRAH